MLCRGGSQGRPPGPHTLHPCPGPSIPGTTAGERPRGTPAVSSPPCAHQQRVAGLVAAPGGATLVIQAPSPSPSRRSLTLTVRWTRLWDRHSKDTPEFRLAVCVTGRDLSSHALGQFGWEAPTEPVACPAPGHPAGVSSLPFFRKFSWALRTGSGPRLGVSLAWHLGHDSQGRLGMQWALYRWAPWMKASRPLPGPQAPNPRRGHGVGTMT